MKRNAELEAAILAASDDLEPRMIYADWLQAQGDPWGEWVALRAAAEAGDQALRIAAIEYQAAHHEELFGAAAPAVKRAYIGSRGGFCEELRINPHEDITPASVKALLAHPSMRFVRHVACGEVIPNAVVDGLVAAKLPLLEELVVQDAAGIAPIVHLRGLAALGLQKLSVRRAALEEPLPGLRELTYVIDGEMALMLRAWLGAGHGDRLEALTLVSDGGDVEVPLIGTNAPNARLRRWDSGDIYEPRSVLEKNPILQLARERGRAAIRHIPAAGHALAKAIEADLRAPSGDPGAAIAFGDIALTLPVNGTHTALFAGLVRERAGDLAGAELCGREALVSTPNDPNLHAMVIDAMRRTGRIEGATKLIPAAMNAIASPDPDALPGARVACLVDCMLTLARAGRYEQALVLPAPFTAIADDAKIHAIETIVYCLISDPVNAKAAWKKASRGQGGLIEHARAMMAKTPGDRDKALAAAKRASYGDLDWLIATVSS
ncbi:MAG: TIGR02996 domain-containing protein [Kofleriaceae bacterium]